MCRARTGVPVAFKDTSSGAVRFRLWEFGDGRQSKRPSATHGWTVPGFYEVTLRVDNGVQESELSQVFLVEAANPRGTCEPDAETRCLQDSRYSVVVDWWSGNATGGRGSVVPVGTNDSGLFQFFDSDNWEVLIKVLDGCPQNGNVWVFGASTTDRGYRIEVRDTVTGMVREYRNDAGRPAQALIDSSAFPEGCRPQRSVR